MFNLGTGIGSSSHNGEFKVDPDALKIALNVYKRILKRLVRVQKCSHNRRYDYNYLSYFFPQEKAFYRSARMPFQAKTQENDRKGYLAVVQSL